MSDRVDGRRQRQANMNGNAYAFDAENGKILRRAQLDGAAGGGLVS